MFLAFFSLLYHHLCFGTFLSDSHTHSASTSLLKQPGGSGPSAGLTPRCFRGAALHCPGPRSHSAKAAAGSASKAVAVLGAEGRSSRARPLPEPADAELRRREAVSLPTFLPPAHPKSELQDFQTAE